MTRLTVVGPYLYLDPSFSDYLGQTRESLGEITFRRSNINPLVGEMYRVANNFARNFGVEVQLPVASPESDPDALWTDALRNLGSADAVFAVFDVESQAIGLETMLARRMNLPLLVAVMDTDTAVAARLEEAGFRVIDARLGPYEVTQAIVRLFDERPRGSGVGSGGGVPLAPPPPPQVPLHR